MPKSFHKTIQVTQDDLDDLHHVNNVRYVQWIQDIAKEHWREKAPKELLEQSIWVVKSHFIEYKRAAVLDDIIDIKTYIKESKGALSIRMVEMHDQKTKQLLLKSKTEWVLLDSQSNRPIRVSDDIIAIFK
ncbi:acyl-CoA thioesterase [Cellulophaga sp. HaHa_2_95]|uniref:acyl-CoA thioesterase n=1 Tax=unclassified Cellulophaga TaxID=2634405 RepID=UPI001C4FA1F0|nr:MULTISPECIES: thioesterase family protein [unclassified Cellulophaga]QXP52936.1 acyl-CoA thioesterase [Cellulophaga sp. HaHa_2_1]QXP54791.1 acyl-CoA thioesterase [Cellulophaga sp. HaHa_2_95]